MRFPYNVFVCDCYHQGIFVHNKPDRTDNFYVIQLLTINRDHFVNAPSQWETMLQCNIVCHWLGAFTKWSLHQVGKYIHNSHLHSSFDACKFGVTHCEIWFHNFPEVNDDWQIFIKPTESQMVLDQGCNPSCCIISQACHVVLPWWQANPQEGWL